MMLYVCCRVSTTKVGVLAKTLIICYTVMTETNYWLSHTNNFTYSSHWCLVFFGIVSFVLDKLK